MWSTLIILNLSSLFLFAVDVPWANTVSEVLLMIVLITHSRWSIHFWLATALYVLLDLSKLVPRPVEYAEQATCVHHLLYQDWFQANQWEPNRWCMLSQYVLQVATVWKVPHHV